MTWPRHEIFGAPECPVLHRFTLAHLRAPDGPRLMLHWFVPKMAEPDWHDHPRDFLTLILWGSYDDVSLNGRVDRVRAPGIRFRRAEHTHRTAAGKCGCLTLALFRRRRREWFFYRGSRHDRVPWREWIHSTFRCP